jgi:hypothetical protein
MAKHIHLTNRSLSKIYLINLQTKYVCILPRKAILKNINSKKKKNHTYENRYSED